MLGLLFQVSAPQDASTIYSGQAFSSVSFILFGLVGYFLSPLLGRLIAYESELGHLSSAAPEFAITQSNP